MTLSKQDALATYLAFTKSPVRGARKRTVDFEEIWRHPFVTGISFIEPSILAVTTKDVYISDPGTQTTHRIGQFIIFIVRLREKRRWTCKFWFLNCSHQLRARINETGDIATYHHPHMCLCDEKIGNHHVACLCIADGQHGIYQSIRNGDIAEAIKRLIKALHTYDETGAYQNAHIEHWPQTKVTP